MKIRKNITIECETISRLKILGINNISEFIEITLNEKIEQIEKQLGIFKEHGFDISDLLILLGRKKKN